MADNDDWPPFERPDEIATAEVDKVKGKSIKRDVQFALRRGTIGQVTTALDAAQCIVEDELTLNEAGLALYPRFEDDVLALRPTLPRGDGYLLSLSLSLAQCGHRPFLGSALGARDAPPQGGTVLGHTACLRARRTRKRHKVDTYTAKERKSS